MRQGAQVKNVSDLQHHESNVKLHMNATHLRLGSGPKEVPGLLWMLLRGLWYGNQLWFLETTLAPVATRNSLSWHTSQCIYKLWMLKGHVDQQSQAESHMRGDKDSQSGSLPCSN
jgi:hypothetical protein